MSEGNTGFYLAISVLTIYVIFGPVILLGVYSFFDWLAEKERKNVSPKENSSYLDKNPDLWSEEDVRKYLKG